MGQWKFWPGEAWDGSVLVTHLPLLLTGTNQLPSYQPISTLINKRECFSEAQKYTTHKPFSNFTEEAEVERAQPASGLTGTAFSLCSSTQVLGSISLTVFIPSLSTPHIRSSQHLFLFPLWQGALLGCLMFLESSLAWHDMSLGHLEELTFALSGNLPILSALPGGHSPWWMRGRSQRVNSAVFSLPVLMLHCKTQQVNSGLFLEAFPTLFIVVWSYLQLTLY